MGFDEEWAQLRTEAAARQNPAMRLNQLAAPDGGGGGSADFGSDEAKKKTASGKLGGEVKTQTETAAKKADEETAAAITAFSGWDTAAGLKTVETTWDNQVKNLLSRLATESHNLAVTRRMFLGQDNEIYNGFRPLLKPAPEPGVEAYR
ncbi:hypothetical protein GCM10010215_67110 [Streptomyces virginiae]|uniref:Uncharacterized protein n=1 Tax=Streptomyces virginiae TaxID=1961 RepID=A0ABQ3NMX8_STRVG|nr:hypothetical protein [Streptomyces virginiae]MBP2341997.1 hypothetical protein [Streptomyces virginiae]GGQ33740.1 hypothetical protein GCM10010215_67110 [Streptomyces virginiae]GHI14127.1 hypothetical protein Scinn_35900 [Streptomyces virginiae]